MSVIPLTPLAGEYGNVALEGLKTVLGVARWDRESLGPRVPYAKDADIGERAFGLYSLFPGERRFSNPNPVTWSVPSSWSSGGGVGVLGGIGSGMLDAMTLSKY